MNTKDQLEKIGLNSDNCVVIGSGILAALGIRESKDIDAIVSGKMYTQLKLNPRFHEGINHTGRKVLADDMFEIFRDWSALGKTWTFEDILDKSIVIEGVRYHPLEFLLNVKRSWLKDADVRQKDIDDVKLIEKYLETHETTS